MRPEEICYITNLKEIEKLTFWVLDIHQKVIIIIVNTSSERRNWIIQKGCFDGWLLFREI